MDNSVKRIREIVRKADENKVRFVSFQFSDPQGKLRSVTATFSDLESALQKGLPFDGASIEGFSEVEKSDLLLKPDIDTFCTLPWTLPTAKTARFICDIYEPDGEKRFAKDPRRVLEAAISKASDDFGKHISLMVAPEIEFWMLRREGQEVATYDQAGYLDLPPLDRGDEIRKEVASNLEAMGLKCGKLMHEQPIGKNEITMSYGAPIPIADATVTFKWVVKTIVHMRNITASFMPKPFRNIAGCGMHVHQNLVDEKGRNLFYDRHSETKLSDVAMCYIGGLLKHAKALSAVLTPSVNSYKRLVPVSTFEAPVYLSWAKYNRSALIRIPSSVPEATRLEYRAVDASCNPYLAFSAMLAAGMDGVKNQTKPPSPIERNVYKLSSEEMKRMKIDVLPASLKEALEELERDRVVRDSLTEPVYEEYRRIKKSEWEDYSLNVSEWERARYLDV